MVLAQLHAVQTIHILFDSDERLLQFLFHHKYAQLRLPAEELLDAARAFSHGEFLLIQVAIDLWCGQATTPLRELLTTLDNANLTRVLQAIAYQGEMVEACEALSCYI